MENKEKNKSIIVVLILFIVLTLVFGGYILYDKVISNENNKINDDTSGNQNNENLNKTLENNVYKILYDNEKTYLAVKDNSNYKVVYDLGENIHYIGIYNNKAYYSDTSLKYIDLTDTNLSEKVWLEIPQYDCSNSTEHCEPINICNSKIVDNTLYFNTCSFAAGRDDLDGLLSLDMNASQFKDYKKISPLAEEWFVDEKGENIYYLNFYRDDNAVYKYNISSSNVEKLFNTTNDSDHINYISDNVIYYNNTKDELSLYNVKTKASTILAKNLSEVTRFNGSMWGICQVVGTNLYYYDSKDTIMKYDSTNGNKTNYYKIEDTFYYRGYAFYDDNTFEITYDCYKYNGNDQGHTCNKTKDYIYNNKIVDQFPTINVTMLDGSLKAFTIADFQ